MYERLWCARKYVLSKEFDPEHWVFSQDDVLRISERIELVKRRDSLAFIDSMPWCREVSIRWSERT